jgi:cytochrome b involved in lipid metabolism
MKTQNKSLIVVSLLIVLGIGAFIFSNSNDRSVTTDQQASIKPEDESTENPTASAPQTITLAMVEERDKKDDCWTIIEGNVYDITSYVPRHPGGDEILLACGRDGTSLFVSRTDNNGQKVGSGTPHSSGAKNQLQSLYIGKLE